MEKRAGHHWLPELCPLRWVALDLLWVHLVVLLSVDLLLSHCIVDWLLCLYCRPRDAYHIHTHLHMLTHTRGWCIDGNGSTWTLDNGQRSREWDGVCMESLCAMQWRADVTDHEASLCPSRSIGLKAPESD